MVTTKTKLSFNSFLLKLLRIVGILWSAFFAIGFIISVTDSENPAEGITIALIGLALGSLLIVCTTKSLHLIKTAQNYIKVINSTPGGYIPEISSTLGVSQEKVKKNLEKIINKNYIPNAFIDYVNNCIILENNQKSKTPSTPPAPIMVNIKCPNCGGKNTIRNGANGICEYCGSSIVGQNDNAQA